MSFYGNVQYNISKSFASAVVETGEPENPQRIDAETRVDLIGFAPGDEWIKLDVQRDAIQGTDKFDQIKFSHKDANSENTNVNIAVEKINGELPSGQVAVKLSDEDYLKITSLKYDSKGHIAGVEETYLQMQATPTIETDISNLTERVVQLENFDKEQEKLNTTYNGLEERITGFETNIENLQTKDQQIDSEISTINTNQSNTQKDLDILEKLIGNLSSLSIGESTDTNIYNYNDLVALLTNMINKIQSNEASITTINLALKVIETLEEDIKALEGRIEELENSNKETT